MFQGYYKYFYVIFALAIVGCAKRGTINGGLKDTLAPVLRNAIPKIIPPILKATPLSSTLTNT
jgi:hypothetical protein